MIATRSDVVFHAVVLAADGVRFSTSAPTAAARTPDLVEYISERCDYTLWPAKAKTVRALLAAERLDDAVTTYFANVGRRWDEELLELSEIRNS